MSDAPSIEQFDPMEAIINNTEALVYVIDLTSYEILYANDKCKKIFGAERVKHAIKCCSLDKMPLVIFVHCNNSLKIRFHFRLEPLLSGKIKIRSTIIIISTRIVSFDGSMVNWLRYRWESIFPIKKN